MQDFIRIGGEIISQPLNENFRRLHNEISIANTNLVFSKTDGIVDTITDMLAIEEPSDAQVCYVISSGELYRYSKGDETWHKIMDVGQTFRQGFLNSGAIVLEDYIRLKDDSTTTLVIPNMLVYYKNQPGDDRYLKGMYLLPETELDISNYTNGANAYSIGVKYTQDYVVTTGLPKEDDPDIIYLGTVLVNSNNEIIKHFIYTLPDMAFTADRGHFFIYGGEAEGLNLLPSGNADKTVNRASGSYYDEGINFTIGQTDDYPIDTDNGSNYNLKWYQGEAPVENLYYMTPKDALSNEITLSSTLIYDKYWNGTALVDVPADEFTIQEHLLTPNGQNIILYGTEVFNSMTDAVSNLNTNYGLDVDFPYVHATKVIVQNDANMTTDDSESCRFFTMGRLSQVGTVSPEFADNVFKLYSGKDEDTTPAYLQFSLDNLEAENFDTIFTLYNLPYTVARKYFYSDSKYITDDETASVTSTIDTTRNVSGIAGYTIADNVDLQDAIARIESIEQEIWEPEVDSAERYNQSVRYRLFHLEDRADKIEEKLDNHETRITYLEENKVHKDTTVNGYTLGDTTDNAEAKSVELYTGDINEGNGLGSSTNLWYTEARVSANEDVVNATTHINTKSTGTKDSTLSANTVSGHTQVNPHNLFTDDIYVLSGSDKLFVSAEEERRIRSDKLPDDTIQALADLDEKNLDNVGIYTIGGSSINPGSTISKLGDIKNIRFYEDGVNLSIDSDGETLVLECTGQVDEDTVMTKNVYATIEEEFPDLYTGYVDKAVNAEYAEFVYGIESATASQYYGTNSEGTVGIYDLPTYVSTADASSYTDIDQVTFVPVDGSVQEKHLESTLAAKINNNYHSIYNSGALISDEVNTFNFGDNLSVTLSDNTVTINATGSGSAGETNFANLADVDVTYTGNGGKVLVVNDAEDGVTLDDMPSLTKYMLKATYVSDTDITKIKKAEHADEADLSTLATTANNSLKLSDKTVDDTGTSTSYLWTAAQIISNTSSQIDEEGVNTYSGASVPDSSLGKDGDLYILLES